MCVFSDKMNLTWLARRKGTVKSFKGNYVETDIDILQRAHFFCLITFYHFIMPCLFLKTNKHSQSEMSPFAECERKCSLRWTSTRCCSFVFFSIVCVCTITLEWSLSNKYWQNWTCRCCEVQPAISERRCDLNSP